MRIAFAWEVLHDAKLVLLDQPCSPHAENDEVKEHHNQKTHDEIRSDDHQVMHSLSANVIVCQHQWYWGEILHDSEE